MPTRRHALALGAAFIALPALGLARDNPMPEALREALERDPNAPVLGNPEGDITLTQFFDYNCPFCRQLMPEIPRLIAADPGLRIVFREWPVFGEGSEFAARAALATLDQGKYWPMHAGLMGLKNRAAEPTVLRVAEAQGIDLGRMRTEMEAERVAAHIARSHELADHMGLVGTPTLIAGDEGHFGRASLEELQAMIARARETLG
ncbi:thioredoxin domain-containing protein [Paracoccus sp. S-4012]|uniref:DsbA family protein n=1 Tax=Paracoccus sp. S-4012 TaxID=2665648 RepID=UPI0012B0ACB2|nr:DsbA family protein [Paracoccus sp. S-4012]MRX50763.1 thioredoxin domain-containing protein [Paracoccus sp. S-4012]